MINFIRRWRKNWFPQDPIQLKSVLSMTFLGESNRGVLRLIIAIFISAFLLVMVKNAYHQAFMKLQALKQQHDTLHTEWMQLMIEEATWGNYDRVNQVAIGTLQMTVPSPFNTKILVVTTPYNDSIRAKAENSILGKQSFDEGYLPTPQPFP
jgi:cell division protein FtsL